VRIVTWNVARRSTRLSEQAAALAGRAPDVVALQEITRQTLPLWRAALETIGIADLRSSLDRPDSSREKLDRRRTGVLIGCHARLSDAAALPVPRPETATAAVARSASTGPVEIHCVHVPNAANGWVKVRTLEAIRAGLAGAPTGPRVLCGDLNIPRRELPTGEVLSFARDSRGRLRPERGPEWDKAELRVVPGLRELGYRDAFRSLHGYAHREPSWTWRRIAGHDGGWRLDHLFASEELELVSASYHHAWREEGLSDHSALEVDLQRRTAKPPLRLPGCH
jgi:endonuclease/exonuclease/phosphatase family metal-dependent hydrolase